MSDDKELIERVAKAIYLHSMGASPEEAEFFLGKKLREWGGEKEWDTDPNELTEWERDEYRVMAKAAIDAMRSK